MPKNFYDEGCCGEGEDVVNGGVCVFPASFRLPNRTTFTAAGPCNGAGNTFFHPTDNAIYSRFNATSGPILQVPPPANTSPSPVPIGGVDDGVNPPVLAPLNTVSATPFGDFSDAIVRLGTPSASAPTLAASRITIDPMRDSITVAPTITVHRNSAIGAGNPDGLIVDFTSDGGPGTLRTLIVRSSDASFQADLTAEGVANGFLGVHSGPAGGPKIRITQTTAPQGSIRNDLDGAGGSMLYVASTFHDFRNLTRIGSSSGTQVTIDSGALPANPPTISTIAGSLNLESSTNTIIVTNTAEIGSAGSRVRIASNAITELSGNLTISNLVASGITLTPFSGFVTFTVPGPGAIQPAVASQGDVGTVALPWRNGVFSGSVTAGSIVLGAQAVNTVFAGPAAGPAAAPTFRLLVANDIPATLNSTTISTQLTVTTITTPAATDLTITPLGGDLDITNADVNPTSDATQNLGDATHRWASLFLATGLAGSSNLIADLSGAASRTFSFQNSSGVCHVDISGGLDVGASVANATGVAHALELRGGSAGTFGSLFTTLGVIALTTTTATNLTIWPNAFGSGTLSLVATTSQVGSFDVSSGNVTFTFSGGSRSFIVVDQDSVTNIFRVMESGPVVDVASGSFQVGGSTVITSGRVTNNLDVDFEQTGMILRMKEAASVANNRELVIDESTSPPTFIYQDSGGTEHELQFTT